MKERLEKMMEAMAFEKAGDAPQKQAGLVRKDGLWPPSLAAWAHRMMLSDPLRSLFHNRLQFWQLSSPFRRTIGLSHPGARVLHDPELLARAPLAREASARGAELVHQHHLVARSREQLPHAHALGGFQELHLGPSAPIAPCLGRGNGERFATKRAQLPFHHGLPLHERSCHLGPRASVLLLAGLVPLLGVPEPVARARPEEMRSDLPGSTPTTRLEDPVGATYNSALFALGSGLTRLRWNTMELEEFLLEEQRGRLASSRFLVLALPAKHVHDAHYEVFGDYRKFDAGLEAGKQVQFQELQCVNRDAWTTPRMVRCDAGSRTTQALFDGAITSLPLNHNRDEGQAPFQLSDEEEEDEYDEEANWAGGSGFVWEGDAHKWKSTRKFLFWPLYSESISITASEVHVKRNDCPALPRECRPFRAWATAPLKNIKGFYMRKTVFRVLDWWRCWCCP
ncbi:hypothetical protein BASA82_000158 [Batrachochytrium salamandrivorans]|nr:hypothetical protein BASA82_000158 [Batrachochytrium salamandrivorans]